MTRDILQFDGPVTLIGGGEARREDLSACTALAPDVIAADGGANPLTDWGVEPAAVIGDMDSIAAPDFWRRQLGDGFIELAEQDTTDLEKCLYTTAAPLYLGIGFLGARLDHSLAALHVLLKYPDKKILLVTEHEVALTAGTRLSLTMEAGATVSFFPLRPVLGVRSTGLKWPLDNLALDPMSRIGTSNAATGGAMEIAFDRSGVIAILPRTCLPTLVAQNG